MNRDEAARVLRNLMDAVSIYDVYDWHEAENAFEVALDALREPQLDENGLVPCGCGGRAFVYCPVDMTDVFVIKCEKCRVGIAFAMDLPRAKKEWNTAMGWRAEG